jgi:hypothetical protein
LGLEGSQSPLRFVGWVSSSSPPGEIAMNNVKSPSTGLTCGITVRDLGLCTVPVAILFASILTLL